MASYRDRKCCGTEMGGGQLLKTQMKMILLRMDLAVNAGVRISEVRLAQ